MLMLHCLVFAAAGPWMPGDGDVSPMDPTIAYGAAPNMLVFAPDGGAGFDLVGQDSYVEFLTSWNTTIAGPLGTSGAQNVIPPIPKGPMAVRATPWGRNGGVFRIEVDWSGEWYSGLTTSQRTQGSELLTRVLYDAARGHKAQACYHNLDLEHWRPEAAQ